MYMYVCHILHEFNRYVADVCIYVCKYMCYCVSPGVCLTEITEVKEMSHKSKIQCVWNNWFVTRNLGSPVFPHSAL